MDVNVSLALIALVSVTVTGMITPIAVGYVQYRIRLAERAEDKIREDKVAREVAQVAITQGEHAAVIDGKLGELQTLGISTHGLVNSRLSAILLSLHDALVGQIEALRDNIVVRQRDGEPPTADALAAVEKIRKRIADLEAVIADRKTQPPIPVAEGR